MKIVKNLSLWNKIDEWLMADQSPELIAGRLEEQEKDLPSVSKNSIRRYIKSVYGRRIEAHRKHRRRCYRRHRKTRLKDRKFIDQRPISSEKRSRVGHAEGDFLASGKSGKGVVLNITDRRLRYKFLERILHPIQRNITRATRRIKRRYPEWKTLTIDNDILLQHHRHLEEVLGIKIFFCHEGRPWQKGSVEESNMEVRKYLPKSSDISKYSRYRTRKIEEKLNNRFMKCLNYLTPKEALEKYRKQKTARKRCKNGCSD
jgi:IS30 family transposase